MQKNNLILDIAIYIYIFLIFIIFRSEHQMIRAAKPNLLSAFEDVDHYCPKSRTSNERLMS